SDPNSFVKVTEEGYGQRLGQSIVGALMGLGLFFGSFVLLWWNEGNVVAEKEALTEMQKMVVKTNAAKPAAEHDGKLVHATAKLETSETLGDAPYLKEGKFLAIERKVEMYQWVEDEESESSTSVGGKKTTTTKYTYKLAWREGRVDSESFQKPEGHRNPP